MLKKFVFHIMGDGQHVCGTISATCHIDASEILMEKYKWAERIQTQEVFFGCNEIEELLFWNEFKKET